MTRREMDLVNQIVDAVCKAFSVTRGDLDQHRGSPQLTFARHVTWTLIHEKTRLSLSQIGLIFGKDHGSVSHGISRLQDVFETEPLEKARFEAVRALFPMKGRL